MRAELRQLYWRLRWCRGYDQAQRRRLYRAISAVKRKFDGLGVDAELVRLFCRHLANPQNPFAETRYLMRVSYLNGIKTESAGFA